MCFVEYLQTITQHLWWMHSQQIYINMSISLLQKSKPRRQAECGCCDKVQPTLTQYFICGRNTNIKIHNLILVTAIYGYRYTQLPDLGDGCALWSIACASLFNWTYNNHLYGMVINVQISEGLRSTWPILLYHTTVFSLSYHDVFSQTDTYVFHKNYMWIIALFGAGKALAHSYIRLYKLLAEYIFINGSFDIDMFQNVDSWGWLFPIHIWAVIYCQVVAASYELFLIIIY